MRGIGTITSSASHSLSTFPSRGRQENAVIPSGCEESLRSLVAPLLGMTDEGDGGIVSFLAFSHRERDALSEQPGGLFVAKAGRNL